MPATETDFEICIRQVRKSITPLLINQNSNVPEMLSHQNKLADIYASASKYPEQANAEMRKLLESLRPVVGKKVESFVLPEIVEEFLNCKDQSNAIHKAAFHEAGHVVVAAKRGIEIDRSIGMCVDLFGKGYSKMRLRPPGASADYPISRESSIIVLFAGRIAEMQFDPLSQGKSASCDLSWIKELQNEVPLIPLSDLEGQSRTLVNEGWRPIEQLAKELLGVPYENRSESENWSECTVARYLRGEKISAILRSSGIELKLTSPYLAETLPHPPYK